MNDEHEHELTDADDDRFELLNRLADRLLGLDLDRHEIDWTTLPDGGEALPG